MKRICFLILCVLAAGCGATPVVENKTRPNLLNDGGSIEARARVPSSAAAAPSAIEAPAAGEKSPRDAFPADARDGRTREDGRGEADEALKRPELADPEDEKEDAEPSPHDISLPLPEIEEGLDSPPPPPEEAPRAKAALYDVPVVRNALVNRWIAYFTGPGRASFSRWLNRSGRYVKLFREVLKERRLPQDLAYLPLIESGFNSRARSRAGAVGQWQFMPGTARIMGLKINFYVDERRNPIKSARAAAAYLSKLHEEFGDWHLALAGYNAGEHRIMRAMRRTGRKDYWSLARTRRLPNETRQYVAKYLAGMIIAKNPEAFGFSDVRYDPPWNYKSFPLPHGVSLRAVSRAAGVPLRALRRINAELRTSVTPPRKGYRIFLPNGGTEGVAAKLASLPKRYLRSSGHYRIRPGDTFGAIARRFRIPLRALMELNAHLHPRRLRPGDRIRLSRRGRRPKAAPRGLARTNNGNPETHVVRRGENFWLIARKYGVSTRRLMRLNPNVSPKRIQIGMKVRLPAAKPKRPAAAEKAKDIKAVEKKDDIRPSRHLVEPGENVWIIARRYGVSTQSLLAWNRLSDSARIFPGNRLIIRR